MVEPFKKEDAVDILEDYIPLIKEAVSKAVSDYYTGEEYSKTRHIHSPRTAASICHDNIKEEIQSRFEDIPKVRTKVINGIFTLIVQEVIAIRFKKFNDKLLGSGISTNQALAYNLHDTVQLDLDGMPPSGLLYVGYTLNKLQSNIDGIYITHRYGDINIWDWEITYEGAEVNKEPALFPQPAATETTTKRRRVRAKDKSISAGDNNAVNE